MTFQSVRPVTSLSVIYIASTHNKHYRKLSYNISIIAQAAMVRESFGATEGESRDV